MDTYIKSFLPQRFIIILALLALGFSLIACSGTSEQKSDTPPEGTGSLSRTFKIIDEKGRASGTLTIDPLGGVTLRDENGNIIGKFKPDTSAQTPSTDAPPETQTGEETSENQEEESKPKE
jgi:hypothetical protein